MPSGIYNRQLSKPNSGLFKEGHLTWNKNKKGIMPVPWNKGRKETRKEVLKKLSESHKGYKHTKEQRKKISEKLKGEKSYLWKGGISEENSKIRHSLEYRLWREAVWTRDNWTCQKCGQRGGKLHTHHIFNFNTYLDLRFAIDNGITLCKKCHDKFHKIYGKKNNTKEQLEEFLANGKLYTEAS